jgi:phage anti-repressor protein/phage antirepressor YoqD-like protein
MKIVEVTKDVVEAFVNIFQSNIDGEDVNSVDLRDVHATLGSKYRYGDWVKDRIADFVEGVDFTSFQKTLKADDINGLPTYKTERCVIATLDTAKSIAMIERNEQGKALRKYFIDFEKKARATPQFEVPTTLGDALIRAGKLALEKDALALEVKEANLMIAIKNAKIMEDSPKVADWNAYMESRGFYDMNTLANILDVGRNLLFEFLRDHDEFTGTLPKSKFRGRGYFVVKTLIRESGTLSDSATYVAPRGFDYIKKLVKEADAYKVWEAARKINGKSKKNKRCEFVVGETGWSEGDVIRNAA